MNTPKLLTWVATPSLILVLGAGAARSQAEFNDFASRTLLPAAGGDHDHAAHAKRRVVEITVDEKGFSPSKVEAKQGEKLTLRFVRKSDKTCATKVTFPELKVTKELPLNKPVDVEVPTASARTLGFQCGMGMYKSSVVIHAT